MYLLQDSMLSYSKQIMEVIENIYDVTDDMGPWEVRIILLIKLKNLKFMKYYFYYLYNYLNITYFLNKTNIDK